MRRDTLRHSLQSDIRLFVDVDLRQDRVFGSRLDERTSKQRDTAPGTHPTRELAKRAFARIVRGGRGRVFVRRSHMSDQTKRQFPFGWCIWRHLVN